ARETADAAREASVAADAARDPAGPADATRRAADAAGAARHAAETAGGPAGAGAPAASSAAGALAAGGVAFVHPEAHVVAALHAARGAARFLLPGDALGLDRVADAVLARVTERAVLVGLAREQALVGDAHVRRRALRVVGARVPFAAQRLRQHAVVAELVG